MIDNIDKLIEAVKFFQKADHIGIKNDFYNKKIYYSYSKIIEILKEIKTNKIKNFYNMED